ncbi:hypothetical protein D3C71_1843180 [compost metagenome]
MHLERLQQVLLGLSLDVSSIDTEYPRKFIVYFDSLDKLEIIAAVLKYFDHENFDYLYTDAFHKERSYDVDYKDFVGLEHVKGMIIKEE